MAPSTTTGTLAVAVVVTAVTCCHPAAGPGPEAGRAALAGQKDAFAGLAPVGFRYDDSPSCCGRTAPRRLAAGRPGRLGVMARRPPRTGGSQRRAGRAPSGAHRVP